MMRSFTAFRMTMFAPYIRLMRLNQPVGIWLLLWPCWWGIALATHGWPSPFLLIMFALGAITMRSAGCIINDMADREFDRQVERTKNRPLASRELSMKQAGILLAALLAAGLWEAWMVGEMAVLWGALSLIPVAMYPFMKRISWWPQLFLGLTFNWGALMSWAVVRGAMEPPAIFLYLGGIFWTLGYDTVYAHQDKKDDARIGVKSTALRLGDQTKKIVGIFYILATSCWALAGFLAGEKIELFALLILVQLHFGWQIYTLNIDNPLSCRKIFLSNTRLGWVVFAGFIFGNMA